MNAYADKAMKRQELSAASAASTKESGGQAALQFMDHRPAAVAQRKLQAMADHGIAARPSLRAVSAQRVAVQRKILVGDDWHQPYDETLIDKQCAETKEYLGNWPELKTIFDARAVGVIKAKKDAYLDAGLKKKDDGLEEEDAGLKKDVKAMLRKYNGKRSFADMNDLSRQLAQDVKLKLLKMESIIGTGQTDGQFSKNGDDASTGRIGKSKTLRIYRTMQTESWEKYQKSKNLKDILHGHGGSLGQALYYLLKSRANKIDDVLVEFEFSDSAQRLMDYENISGGGEGGKPSGGKLTGKMERNDVMGLDDDIFSVHLYKSKDLILELNPKVTLKDQALR